MGEGGQRDGGGRVGGGRGEGGEEGGKGGEDGSAERDLIGILVEGDELWQGEADDVVGDSICRGENEDGERKKTGIERLRASLELVMSAAKILVAGFALLLSGSLSSSSELATTLTPTPSTPVRPSAAAISSSSAPCSLTAAGELSGYSVEKRLLKVERASSAVSSSVAWKTWSTTESAQCETSRRLASHLDAQRLREPTSPFA